MAAKANPAPKPAATDTIPAEISASGVDKNQNGGIIEEERMSSSVEYAVPKGLTEERGFREKFDRMDSNKNVCREYYQTAKEILHHRSGNDGEDLYYYNVRLKKWYKSTYGKEKGTPKYTNEIIGALKEANKNEIVSFHNHPMSMPPSIADLNVALANNYKEGYIICHNGKIFHYTKPKQTIDTVLYESIIKNHIKSGKSEYDSQLLALKELSHYYGFTYKEV